MRTILVTGASGIVGYGILRSLRGSGEELHLVGSSIYDDSVAPAFCDVFELAPPTLSPEYLPWLLEVIRRHGIELIIPGIEVDMYEWLAHTAAIEGAGARILRNDLELTTLCQDKWSFFQNLSAAGFDCAIPSSLSTDFDELSAAFGTPVLLKPRRGFGSKGIVRVDGAAAFAEHRHLMGSVLMAQPVVGTDDEEFTSAVFGDGRGGVLAGMTLRRKLSSSGFTDRAEVVDHDEFVETIDALCRHFTPDGPTNFQFRRTADGLKLLEINPRISSSTSIRTAFGYNESAMAVGYYLEGTAPRQPVIGRGKAIRYTDDLIIHEDSVHL